MGRMEIIDFLIMAALYITIGVIIIRDKQEDEQKQAKYLIVYGFILLLFTIICYVFHISTIINIVISGVLAVIVLLFHRRSKKRIK
ncbi:MAG: hypothetical protein K6E13_07810 [Lachnospiraceae bacterium]|nr:hypothetical protein [Lachnospiraceae bacterium]